MAFFHGADGRNFLEPSPWMMIWIPCLTGSELLGDSTPTFIHGPDGRSFRELTCTPHAWQDVRCCGLRPLRLSIAPMEETCRNLHNASTLPFQGGGIFISGGTVTIDGSSIYNNTATYVSACFLNFPGTFIHRPDGRNFQEPSQSKHLTLFGRE